MWTSRPFDPKAAKSHQFGWDIPMGDAGSLMPIRGKALRRPVEGRRRVGTITFRSHAEAAAEESENPGRGTVPQLIDVLASVY